MADIAARREARRRRILENSENRLQIISGLNKTGKFSEIRFPWSLCARNLTYNGTLIFALLSDIVERSSHKLLLLLLLTFHFEHIASSATNSSIQDILTFIGYLFFSRYVWGCSIEEIH